MIFLFYVVSVFTRFLFYVVSVLRDFYFTRFLFFFRGFYFFEADSSVG